MFQKATTGIDHAFPIIKYDAYRVLVFYLFKPNHKNSSRIVFDWSVHVDSVKDAVIAPSLWS